MEKTETTMNLTTLASNGTKLDLALAAARGEIKLTVLKPRRARKGERLADRVGGAGTRWQPAARAPRDGGARLRAGAAAAR